MAFFFDVSAAFESIGTDSMSSIVLSYQGQSRIPDLRKFLSSIAQPRSLLARELSAAGPMPWRAVSDLDIQAA